MNADRHSLIAYIATLVGIVVLSLAAAAVCLWLQAGDEVHVARIIAALGFIGSAVTGLIGVIGTFRPKAQGASDQTVATVLNKLPDAPPPDSPAPVVIQNDPANPVPVANQGEN